MLPYGGGDQIFKIEVVIVQVIFDAVELITRLENGVRRCFTVIWNVHMLQQYNGMQ